MFLVIVNFLPWLISYCRHNSLSIPLCDLNFHIQLSVHQEYFTENVVLYQVFLLCMVPESYQQYGF